MKAAIKAVILAAAALTLCSGCIFDDDFWDDGYDSTYDSPSGSDDDCDCESLVSTHIDQTQHHAPEHHQAPSALLR